MLAACITPRPITLPVTDQLHVTIPALWADRWLPAVAGSYIPDVLPDLLLEEDQVAVARALATRKATVDDLRRAARQAVSAAGARPWWEVNRLAGLADDDTGEVMGRLLLAGIDPARTTLAGWCAALYAHSVQHLDKTDRMRFDVHLGVVPPGAGDDDL
jgi:hypothetical protein